MYLAPVDRPAAYDELARVLKPGAPLAVSFKVGDGQHHRAGRTLNLGIEFDIWWHSPEDLQHALTDAGFSIMFWAGRPADDGEMQPQGYLVLSR
jgi:hypothetical protein